MLVRPYTQNDNGRILKILKQRNLFNRQEIEVAMEVLKASLAPREEVEYYAFCAEGKEGLAEGYICFGPIPMTDGRYDLYWIAVDRDCERRGVGGLLVRYMEKFLKENGAKRIYLDTSSTPPYSAARAFYKRQGYKRICGLPDFYRPGDDKFIFMKEIC